MLIKLLRNTESFKKAVDIKNAIEKIRKLIGLSKVLKKSLFFFWKEKTYFFLYYFSKNAFGKQ